MENRNFRIHQILFRIIQFSITFGFHRGAIYSIFVGALETDFALWFHGRSHEFADGIEKGFDSFVMAFEAAFELGEFPGQGFVALQHPPQTDESAHDGNVDLHGALAAQTRWRASPRPAQ